MDAQEGKKQKSALRVQRWWRRHSRAPCLRIAKGYTYHIWCLYRCHWHFVKVKDVLDSLPRTRKDECIRIYRIYDKMCIMMPSIDDEKWSPKLPCLFADFVDLYRSIIKIVVILKPSSEVLFWLRLMRMITLKLRRLGDVIQPHRGRAKLNDLLNCVSLTIYQMQAVGRRVAETVRADAILLQSFCRRRCALTRMKEALNDKYLSKHRDTLDDKYIKILSFTEEAIEKLSQPPQKKDEELFDKLQKSAPVLRHMIDLILPQEGYSHLVLHLIMECERVERFCREYIQKKEQERIIRLQKRQEEADKLLKEQQERLALREKKQERLALQRKEKEAIAAEKALACLEEDKKQAEQAEQQRIRRQKEIAEIKTLRKQEDEANKGLIALEKAALREKKKAEKAERTANWPRGKK